MEQLSGLDAAFVHQDSARTPMHVTASLLYGVEMTDPVTLGAVVVTLAGTAVVAAWLPARRATAVQPAEALSGD